LKVGPTEAIHVGDSIGEDVEAAGRAGLTGVWLDRTGRGAPPPGVQRITNLSELVPHT
jgi:putative hydrolase of the HAD superfamily